jgi:hypothetical protein
MAAPVLVRAYTGTAETVPSFQSTRQAEVHALPPISSYAFANILQEADCPDLQFAINGIAEICAKNRMSLADEYASHLPPLGEITAASSAAVRPHLNRPGMRRALTSVPEASSSSTEGSMKSKKRKRIFSFRRQAQPEGTIARQICIGKGRTISVSGLTALTEQYEHHDQPPNAGHEVSSVGLRCARLGGQTGAAASLQRLLRTASPVHPR